MDHIIIILHLDQFFNDQRKCCKIYVDGRYKIINDLQEHINTIFNLGSNFYLMDMTSIPYVLLPRSEDIRILEKVTHVMAQKTKSGVNLDNPPKEFKQQEHLELNSINQVISSPSIKSPKAIHSINTNHIDDHSSMMILTQNVSDKMSGAVKEVTNEALKKPVLNNITEQVNLQTSKPKIVIHSVETVNLSPIIETPMEEQTLSNNAIINNESAMDTAFTEGPVCDVICPSLESDPNITTRGRKRIRKRKRLTKSSTPVSTPKHICLLTKAVDTYNTGPSPSMHIRFEEEDESHTGTLNSSMNGANELLSVSQLSESTDVQRKAKIVRALPSDKENVSVINVMKHEECSSTWEDLWKDFNPQEFENVVNLPQENDIIAFRILKMSETYEPELSKYIFGMVLDVVTQEKKCDTTFSFQILAGFECCSQPTGKFQLPTDEENDAENTVLTLKWENVLEPKKLI